MRRLAAVFLVFLLLGALPALAQSPEGFQFTRENFPTLDGSTSMVPLGQAIASVLLGESRESVGDRIAFNRTTQSFRNLRSGQCDLVIAAEPSQEVFDEMKAEAFPYLLEPIAKEALIFVVNENNPVTSLTRDQVRDIYSGKITNWSQVGGEDLPIEAFQRNSAAGSQVMMEKLVMGDTPIMAAPTVRVTQAMGELIEAVRSFDGSANAIGYTVFYYARDMQMAQGLKILKIDGVLPSTQTIRTGEYPYLNNYYCCISATASQDSPQRRLFDWLVSEEGQSLLGLEGYVRISAPGEAEHPGTDVHTDYTSYAPANGTTAQYTDFPCPKDHLAPAPGYGLIFPYSGARLYSGWGDPTEDYPIGNLSGFYNLQGQRITDPIYTAAYPYCLDGWNGGDYIWIVSLDGEHFAFAAKDGSFLSDFCYSSIYSLGENIFCLRDYAAGTFDLYSRDFRQIANQEDFRFDQRQFVPSEYALGLYSGTLHTAGSEQSLYALVDEAGNLLMQTKNYISLNSQGYVTCFNEDWNQTVYDPNLKPIPFDESELVSNAFQFNDRFFFVELLNGQRLISDGNGAIFEQGFDDFRAYPDEGFGIIRGDLQTIYDPKGRTLLRDIPAAWEYHESGVFSEYHPTGLTLYKLPEGTTLTLPGSASVYRFGDILAVDYQTDQSWYYRMADNTLRLFPDTFEIVTSGSDTITGQTVVITQSGNGFSGESRIFTPDGSTELFRGNGDVSILGGQYILVSDWAFSAYNASGKLLFCYPFYGMASGD